MGARILFTSYTADWVGPTHSLLLLLRALRREHEVAVLLPGSGRFAEELARERIRFWSFPTLTKRSLPAMIRLVSRERFDLVYANNAGSTSRLAFLAARFHRVPFICHVRAMTWGASRWRLGYLRWADAVIAVSHACAESVRRFVRPDRLHIVHNGVSLAGMHDPMDGRVNGLRAELGIRGDDVLLLSVSHLCPRKGQTHAIEAMAQILREVPSAHLCFVGSLERDPAYVERARALAHERGVADRVHFAGFRPNVGALWEGADIYLHSAMNDPHPRSVLEAMASSLPVVAFAVDGVAETVVDGKTGRLVNRADSSALAAAVVELLRAPRERERMGRAGRDRVAAHFSADATAERVTRVIAGVLARPGPVGE